MTCGIYTVRYTIGDLDNIIFLFHLLRSKMKRTEHYLSFNIHVNLSLYKTMSERNLSPYIESFRLSDIVFVEHFLDQRFP